MSCDTSHHRPPHVLHHATVTKLTRLTATTATTGADTLADTDTGDDCVADTSADAVSFSRIIDTNVSRTTDNTRATDARIPATRDKDTGPMIAVPRRIMETEIDTCIGPLVAATTARITSLPSGDAGSGDNTVCSVSSDVVNVIDAGISDTAAIPAVVGELCCITGDDEEDNSRIASPDVYSSTESFDSRITPSHGDAGDEAAGGAGGEEGSGDAGDKAAGGAGGDEAAGCAGGDEAAGCAGGDVGGGGAGDKAAGGAGGGAGDSAGDDKAGDTRDFYLQIVEGISDDLVLCAPSPPDDVSCWVMPSSSAVLPTNGRTTVSTGAAPTVLLEATSSAAIEVSAVAPAVPAIASAVAPAVASAVPATTPALDINLVAEENTLLAAGPRKIDGHYTSGDCVEYDASCNRTQSYYAPDHQSPTSMKYSASSTTTPHTSNTNYAFASTSSSVRDAFGNVEIGGIEDEKKGQCVITSSDRSNQLIDGDATLSLLQIQNRILDSVESKSLNEEFPDGCYKCYSRNVETRSSVTYDRCTNNILPRPYVVSSHGSKSSVHNECKLEQAFNEKQGCCLHRKHTSLVSGSVMESRTCDTTDGILQPLTDPVSPMIHHEMDTIQGDHLNSSSLQDGPQPSETQSPSLVHYCTTLDDDVLTPKEKIPPLSDHMCTKDVQHHNECTTENNATLEPSKDGALVPPSKVGVLVPPSKDCALVPPFKDGALVTHSKDGALVPPSKDGALVPPFKDGALVPPSNDCLPTPDVAAPLNPGLSVRPKVLKKNKSVSYAAQQISFDETEPRTRLACLYERDFKLRQLQDCEERSDVHRRDYKVKEQFEFELYCQDGIKDLNLIHEDNESTKQLLYPTEEISQVKCENIIKYGFFQPPENGFGETEKSRDQTRGVTTDTSISEANIVYTTIAPGIMGEFGGEQNATNIQKYVLPQSSKLQKQPSPQVRSHSLQSGCFNFDEAHQLVYEEFTSVQAEDFLKLYLKSVFLETSSHDDDLANNILDTYQETLNTAPSLTNNKKKKDLLNQESLAKKKRDDNCTFTSDSTIKKSLKDVSSCDILSSNDAGNHQDKGSDAGGESGDKMIKDTPTATSLLLDRGSFRNSNEPLPPAPFSLMPSTESPSAASDTSPSLSKGHHHTRAAELTSWWRRRKWRSKNSDKDIKQSKQVELLEENENLLSDAATCQGPIKILSKMNDSLNLSSSILDENLIADKKDLSSNKGHLEGKTELLTSEINCAPVKNGNTSDRNIFYNTPDKMSKSIPKRSISSKFNKLGIFTKKLSLNRQSSSDTATLDLPTSKVELLLKVQPVNNLKFSVVNGEKAPVNDSKFSVVNSEKVPVNNPKFSVVNNEKVPENDLKFSVANREVKWNCGKSATDNRYQLDNGCVVTSESLILIMPNEKSSDTELALKNSPAVTATTSMLCADTTLGESGSIGVHDSEAAAANTFVHPAFNKNTFSS